MTHHIRPALRQRPRDAVAERQGGRHRALELELYEALTELIVAPSEQSYTRVARMVSIVRWAMREQKVTDYDAQIRSAQAALDAIFDRWEDTDGVVARRLEQQTLRAAAPALCGAIQSASTRALATARDRTQAEMVAQGAPTQRHPL